MKVKKYINQEKLIQANIQWQKVLQKAIKKIIYYFEKSGTGKRSDIENFLP